MTVMTMKEITEFMKTVRSQSVPETRDGLEERINEINDVIESLADASTLAKDIVLKKMTEKDFVQFMEAVAKVTVFTGAANNEGDAGGVGMLVALMSGDLQGYTHSVILATIGALINEEIL